MSDSNLSWQLSFQLIESTDLVNVCWCSAFYPLLLPCLQSNTHTRRLLIGWSGTNQTVAWTTFTRQIQFIKYKINSLMIDLKALKSFCFVCRLQENKIKNKDCSTLRVSIDSDVSGSVHSLQSVACLLYKNLEMPRGTSGPITALVLRGDCISGAGHVGLQYRGLLGYISSTVGSILRYESAVRHM